MKKRKITQGDSDGFDMPCTENKQRKKCAVIDDGLAIKYNKLVHNFDKIFAFNHFRRYCVLFDIFSKRHLINHRYRMDFIEKLNCFDFTPYTFENCCCNQLVNKTCKGYLIAFKSKFMHRKQYPNNGEDRSQQMRKLYNKHSVLHEDNNFFDNRINELFREKIRNFEKLYTVMELDKKTRRVLHKNTCQSIPLAPLCTKCKKLTTTNFGTWHVVRYMNHINVATLCDYTIRVDDTFYIPTYKSSSINNITMNINDTVHVVIYKTTKSNIVFIYDGIFYVINPTNTFVILDVLTFSNIKFFCNFTFHFVEKSKKYSNHNFISINKG